MESEDLRSEDTLYYYLKVIAFVIKLGCKIEQQQAQSANLCYIIPF